MAFAVYRIAVMVRKNFTSLLSVPLDNYILALFLCFVKTFLELFYFFILFFSIPLDNYIVAHFLVCVNIFFKIFENFSSPMTHCIGEDFSWGNFPFPWDNYSIAKFLNFVNTFFISYFFNNRARAVRTNVHLFNS